MNDSKTPSGGGSGGEASKWCNSLITSDTQLKGDRLSAELGSWVCYDLGCRLAGWGVDVTICWDFVMLCSLYSHGAKGAHSYGTGKTRSHKQAKIRAKRVVFNPRARLRPRTTTPLRRRAQYTQWERGVMGGAALSRFRPTQGTEWHIKGQE